jgi:hypothetical protein
MPAGPAAAAAPSGAQASAPVVMAVPAGGSPYAPGGSLPPFPNTVTAGGPGELTTCGGGCGSGGCGLEGCPHGDCSNPCNRVWFGADYLLWRIGGQPVPGQLVYNQPLGTIVIPQLIQSAGSPPTSTVINQTLPIFLATNTGTSVVNFKDLPGMRLSGGFWFDQEQCLGVDASFFWLWRKTEEFSNIPVGSPTNTPNSLLVSTGFTDIIAIPGSGTATGLTVPIPINITANINGALQGSVSSQLWGTDFNLTSRSCYFGCATIDCLAGFKFLDLNETLSATDALSINGLQSTQGTITTTPPGTTITTPPSTASTFSGVINDNIRTKDEFYGAQVGANYDICLGGGVFVNGFIKLGLGDMHEIIDQAGFTVASGTTTVFSPPGQTVTTVTTAFGPTTIPGGSLVGPADNGLHRTFDRICFLPDGHINLGYQPCHWLRAYVGYDVMYISSLVRPGNTVAFTQTTGTVTIGGSSASTAISAPTFQIHDTDLWVQGINFGLELRW